MPRQLLPHVPAGCRGAPHASGDSTMAMMALCQYRTHSTVASISSPVAAWEAAFLGGNFLVMDFFSLWSSSLQSSVFPRVEPALGPRGMCVLMFPELRESYRLLKTPQAACHGLWHVADTAGGQAG